MSARTLWVTDTAGNPFKLTCHIEKRQTKKGVVYDVRSRIFDDNGHLIHKRLSGYETEKLAFKAFVRFAQTYRPPAHYTRACTSTKIFYAASHGVLY